MGFGVQYSFANLKGFRVPIITSEQVRFYGGAIVNWLAYVFILFEISIHSFSFVANRLVSIVECIVAHRV